VRASISEIAKATGGHPLQGDPAVAVNGVTTDSRAVKPGQLFVAIRGERFDGHRFVQAALDAGAAAALVERWPEGLATDRPVVLVADTVAAYAAVAGWWRRQVPATVVGVTGSNGKTTTKEMLALALGGREQALCSQANHNNHIGVPETLLRIQPTHRFAVVEMGVNHFGEMEPLARASRPDVALITNIGPTHLEAFGDEAGVAREKAVMLRHLAPGGLAVLHADDRWSRALARDHAGRTATFGFRRGARWRATRVRQAADHVRFVVERTGHEVMLPAAGRCQVSNALAAIAVAAELGIPLADVADRLAAFEPPKWRMEIRKAGPLTLVLDCYNANPASTRAALDELRRRPCPGRRVAVLGDMLELGERTPAAHRAAGKAAAEAGVGLLCAVGDHGALLAAGAVEGGIREADIKVFPASARAEVARWLCGQLRPADTVLFKGSRGMRLEEVADAVAHWAAQATTTRGVHAARA